MANTTPSPNMSMPLPTVAQDPGPDWAQNNTASFLIVDAHNHSAGQGVPITPSGINVSSDLPMNNNNLVTTRTVRFSSQTATLTTPDIGCLYEVGADLYYNDGAGNVVRITQGGAVTGSAGTITGLPSGTASAAYAAGTFTFLSATSTPANFVTGPVKIGRSANGTKSVTLTPNASQASDYAITLPVALPGTSSLLTLDATGQMGTATVTGGGDVVLSSSPTIVNATLTAPVVNSPNIYGASVFGSTISTTSIVSPAFTGQPTGTITSGTYTPTVTDANGSTGAAIGFRYMQVGGQVTVFGVMTVTCNSSGSYQSVISVPIAPVTNFAGGVECNGIAYPSYSSGVDARQSAVQGNPGAKTAIIAVQAVSSVAQVYTLSISFMYRTA